MIKTGMMLVALGFIFNFCETAYFGWNVEPICKAEMICDYIAEGLMLAGGVITVIRLTN